MNSDAKAGKHILLAEDEPAIAELLMTFLVDEGFNVTRVENGREALVAMPRVQPDLVLTDVMMPLLDGLQLYRALRADPEYQAVPVVLMTAVRRDTDPNFSNGVRILYKPFDLDHLLRVIHHLLD